MLVDKIYLYLNDKEITLDEAIRYEIEKTAGYVFKRQFMTEKEKDSKGKLRLSASGKCCRALAYAYHGFEENGKTIDGRARVNFFMGDLCECMVTSLAKLAGVKLAFTGLNQTTCSVKIGDVEVVGHPDGIILEDGKAYLLEVKSMSSFSFARFEKGIIEPSYLSQVNLYMSALNLEGCCFVALNKDNGVLCEQYVKLNPVIVRQAKENLLAVLNSTPQTLPEPPVELVPRSGEPYDWRCLYCAYWKTCHPNAERVLVKNSYKLVEK